MSTSARTGTSAARKPRDATTLPWRTIAQNSAPTASAVNSRPRLIASSASSTDETSASSSASASRRSSAAAITSLFDHDLPCSRESRVEHGLREPSRERVLLARVEASEQHGAAGQLCLREVSELRAWPDARVQPQRRVPGERAQGDDHAHVRHQRELLGGIGQAVVTLGRQRLVRGRRAAHGGGDPHLTQAQPVVRAHRVGLVREARAMERRKQPVTRAVAGEDATRAVAAMRGRGEAQHECPRLRIAEAGDRATPVLLVRERSALLACPLLPPLDQPRAQPAVHYPLFELGEAQSLSLRPVANNQWDQRNAGIASAAVTPSASHTLTSLVPRKP